MKQELIKVMRGETPSTPKRVAIGSLWAGFLVFVVLLFLYGAVLSPFLTGLIGPFTSPLGVIGQTVTFLLIALIAYYIYAFVVKRTGADPSTE